MMIVFDASTLILLAKAELLETFLQSSRVDAMIPREVAREACEVKESADALLIRRLVGEKRIDVASLKERGVYTKLRRDLGLGSGEAEAIGLALAKKADLVATDDRRAIDACKLLNLAFTSAPAILIRMYEQGVVDEESALRKLAVLEREGRYKKSIIAAVRARLEVS
jgi:predicted nucleic acid-binding protein